MKINWGTGIVIAFALFIGFILFLTISMTTDKSLNHDLVTDDYYNKATYYQEEINAEENALKLSENITFLNTEDGYVITFPKNQDFSKINGTVSFYRPSNEKLDFEIPIKLSNNQLLIPKSALVEGRWDVSIKWEYQEVTYLYKDKIRY